MTLTEKTIECAHLCARLEIAGQASFALVSFIGLYLLPALASSLG